MKKIIGIVTKTRLRTLLFLLFLVYLSNISWIFGIRDIPNKVKKNPYQVGIESIPPIMKKIPNTYLRLITNTFMEPPISELQH